MQEGCDANPGSLALESVILPLYHTFLSELFENIIFYSPPRIPVKILQNFVPTVWEMLIDYLVLRPVSSQPEQDMLELCPKLLLLI